MADTVYVQMLRQLERALGETLDPSFIKNMNGSSVLCIEGLERLDMATITTENRFFTDGKQKAMREQAGAKLFVVTKYTYIFRFSREHDDVTKKIGRWSPFDVILSERVDVSAAVKVFRKSAAQLRILTVAAGSE